MLTLSPSQLDRLDAAAQACLRVLDAPSVDAWRSEVCRTVSALCEADRAYFVLSTERNVHVGYARPLPARPALAERTAPVAAPAAAALVPAGGVEEETGPAGVVGPERLLDGSGMYVDFPGGQAFLGVADGDPAPARDVTPFLRLLLPAFKAALHLLDQSRRRHASLDAVGVPCALLGLDGRTCHRSPAFEAVLAAEPERLTLTAAVSDLAAALARASLVGGHAGPAPVERVVRTATRAYRLRATLVPQAACGPGPAVAVTVGPEGAVLPTAEAVVARFGLSPREAEVALLIAAGLANDVLAERLFISPHTARRHTERVLAKLGVGNRSAVAHRLMEA